MLTRFERGAAIAVGGLLLACGTPSEASALQITQRLVVSGLIDEVSAGDGLDDMLGERVTFSVDYSVRQHGSSSTRFGPNVFAFGRLDIGDSESRIAIFSFATFIDNGEFDWLDLFDWWPEPSDPPPGSSEWFTGPFEGQSIDFAGDGVAAPILGLTGLLGGERRFGTMSLVLGDTDGNVFDTSRQLFRDDVTVDDFELLHFQLGLEDDPGVPFAVETGSGVSIDIDTVQFVTVPTPAASLVIVAASGACLGTRRRRDAE
ncbi:MAG: hypothetical protein AAF747_04445 [Planctomycetota bacterium]